MIQGGGTSSASYLDVAGVAFELGATGTIIGSPCEFQRVGCEPIPVAQIVPGAVFDLNSSNQHFAAVAATLANGIDDPLWKVARLFNASGVELFSGGSGGTEAVELDRSPDFTGAQIDLIRITINDFTLGPGCCSDFEYSVDLTWEFFGSTANGEPSVVVDYPVFGTWLAVGDTTQVRWTAGDDQQVTSVDLELSRDRGATYTTIATGLPNTGSYEWIVPGPPHENNGLPIVDSYIRITVHDNDGHSGSARGGRFAIASPETPTLVSQFVARPAADGIEVRWRTAWDGSAEAIELQRSVREAGPWETVRSEARREGDVTVVVDRDAPPGRLAFYRLQVRLADGSSFEVGPISVESSRGSPLLTVGPNPMRRSLKVEFDVPRSQHVRVDVLDVQGRTVQTLEDAMLAAGRLSMTWDGRRRDGPAPAGMYFIRAQEERGTFTKRFVLVR